MSDFATWNTISLLAGWAVFLGFVLVAVVRMVRRGRLEAHDDLSLMPPKVRAWMLGESGWLGRKKPPPKR